MRPTGIFYYKKAWKGVQDKGVQLRVIGPLFSLDCVWKPIPFGTILVSTGKYGSNIGRRYRFIRFRRQIKTKRSRLIWIDEWIKRQDVFNPTLTVRVTPEEKKQIGAKKMRSAVAGLWRFAPTGKNFIFGKRKV